jgi:folylpolyglutamate synthase/dihydropteroate synthase
MKRLKEETFFQRLRKSSSSAESDLMKTITPTEMKAIYSVEWPGRQQIVEHEVNGRTIRILLDVAHTPGLAGFFLDFNSFQESMKICANWSAERTIGKVFVLMRSAMGREIDSQMVHLAEILKPDYFAGAPNVARDVSELDQSVGRMEKYSYFNPSFLTKELEQQLAEVRISKGVDQTGPQNILNIQ